jgi:membrane protein
VTTSPSRGEASVDAVLDRLPARPRRIAEWMLEHWPGRMLLRITAKCIRIELFDRSMTIAAQFFTSVFPIIIMATAWFGSGDSDQVGDAVDLPEESQSVLDQAVQGGSSATFGVVGAVIVLASATSLSRALTRAFAAVWDLPRPKSKLVSAWRWLAVVLSFAASLMLVRILSRVTENVPPPDFWPFWVVSFADVALMVFVPWVLLSGTIPPRLLLPGALLFGVTMVFVRPASRVFLPRALEESAERYGSIGVAFTYLAWLYVVSFCLLVATVIGYVVATDPAGFGRWIRGERSPAPSSDTAR